MILASNTIKSISSSSIGELWINYLHYVLDNGQRLCDDSENIIEAPAIVLHINSQCDESNDEIIERYGDKKLMDLYKNKLFTTSTIPPFKTSYGERLFSNHGENQVKWLIDLLKEKPSSKSASISLLNTNEVFNSVPCLVNIMAKIRENKLCLTSIFRSQNAFNSYANYASLIYLQKFIATELNIEIGDLVSFVNSPHIYEKNIIEINEIINNE